MAALWACGRTPTGEPDEGPTVDPIVYAEGFCALRCWRLEECGLDQGIVREECLEECVDEALVDPPDGPCWAEAIELRRCAVRTAECHEVLGESAPSGPGTTCEAEAADLDACEN